VTPTIPHDADVAAGPFVLSSWKEIAQYLGKGVRTVQRWEHSGLPVHRPNGSGIVCAYPQELDTWIHAGHDAGRETDTLLEEVSHLAAEKEQLTREIAELRVERDSLSQGPPQFLSSTESHLIERAARACRLSKATQKRTSDLIEPFFQHGRRFIVLGLDVASTYCDMAEARTGPSHDADRERLTTRATMELENVQRQFPTYIKGFDGPGQAGVLTAVNQLQQRVEHLRAKDGEF
jgi:hypothetical protein